MTETLTKTAFFSRSLLVALLIPFTFACTGLNIFIANASEMQGTMTTLIPPLCVFVGLMTLILFLAQLPYLFVKKHWFVPINSFLFGCGLLLWIQANIFNWNFGELDGSGVDWSEFRYLMVLEIAVYAAIIALVIWKRQWFYKYVIHLACLLMFMQAVPLALPVMGGLFTARTPQTPSGELTFNPAIPAWKQYEFTYDNFFDYSKEQNVVLIIPDAFGSDTFKRLTNLYPEVLEWFSDFHYFTKQKSLGSTAISVPQILTACEFGEHRDIVRVWNSEGALQKTLSEAGFQTKLHVFYPEAHHFEHHWVSNVRLKDERTFRKNARWYHDLNETGFGQMSDLAFFRSVPIIFKPVDVEQFRFRRFFMNISRLSRDFIRDNQFAQYVADNPASANSEKPVLLVIHLKGAHAPYNMNEKFEYEAMTGIEGEDRQAFAILLLLKRLIDDMKRAKVYDNTIVVIAADHGNRRIDGIEKNALCPLAYNPLLLIKRQNERHRAVVYRDEYTHVQDITPTILGLVGLENLPERFSVFDIPPSVSVQREIEHEAFWAEKRGTTTVPMVKTENNVRISMDITLKRSELEIHAGELWYFAGGNPDTWNNGPLIVMSSVGAAGEHLYRGIPPLVRMNRTWHKFWYSRGKIDLTGVADGEYEVTFLLTQKDGTYAGNRLGSVTVKSGTVKVYDTSSPSQ